MPKDKKNGKNAMPRGKAELEGPQEAKREGASAGWDTFKGAIPFVLIILVFGIAALHMGGVIDISGLLNPDSDKYIFSGFGSTNNNGIVQPKCFTYSAQMDTPCCTEKDNVRVAAVYAFYPECQCPLDTVDYKYNVVFGGKEYRTCDCECPESN